MWISCSYVFVKLLWISHCVIETRRSAVRGLGIGLMITCSLRSCVGSFFPFHVSTTRLLKKCSVGNQCGHFPLLLRHPHRNPRAFCVHFRRKSPEESEELRQLRSDAASAIASASALASRVGSLEAAVATMAAAQRALEAHLQVTRTHFDTSQVLSNPSLSRCLSPSPSLSFPFVLSFSGRHEPS